MLLGLLILCFVIFKPETMILTKVLNLSSISKQTMFYQMKIGSFAMHLGIRSLLTVEVSVLGFSL